MTGFELTLLDYVLIGMTAFVASVINGLGGFGGGFLVIFAMTPIVGVKSVIPLMAVFALVSNFSRVLYYWKGIDFGAALRFSLGALPGIYIGTRIFDAADEKILQLIVGLTLLVMVPLRHVLRRRSIKVGLTTILAGGFVFGVISGTSIGAGLLAVTILMNIGLFSGALLGTDALIGVIMNVVRGTFFALDGHLRADLAVAGLLMGIMTFPGTWVSAQIVRRLEVNIHTRLLEGLVIAGGLYFVIDALIP